jgi:hypothetical protein
VAEEPLSELRELRAEEPLVSATALVRLAAKAVLLVVEDAAGVTGAYSDWICAIRAEISSRDNGLSKTCRGAHPCAASDSAAPSVLARRT